MKVTRTKVLLVVGAAIGIAIAVMLPRGLRRLAFFRVHQIEVIGARYLDESDVARQLGLPPTASTFDRLGPVQAAAAAIGGVASARVERVLPGTLRVTLREAVPVAVVALPDRVVLMDSLGRILPFDPTRAPASLPIATQDSAVAALLARLKLTDPSLYSLVESARLERTDVVLDLGPRRIRLRPEADGGVLRAVSSVLGYLNTGAIAWREIDARYRDRVFVQKGAA